MYNPFAEYQGKKIAVDLEEARKKYRFELQKKPYEDASVIGATIHVFFTGHTYEYDPDIMDDDDELVSWMFIPGLSIEIDKEGRLNRIERTAQIYGDPGPDTKTNEPWTEEDMEEADDFLDYLTGQ